MEKQLNYEEWFFQSDYDLETADYMLQSGRNVYCIFMCHLSLQARTDGRYLPTNKNHTAMDNEPLIKDKETALEIIAYMHHVLIKHGVTPCRIALFGSFLNGNYHAESDLDMIIISESFEGKNLDQRICMTISAQKEVRKRYIVPMDILMKTPQEYNNPKMKFFESEIVV